MSFPPGTEMFQFPGFALKTLCIQELSTCLCLLLTTSHHAPNRPRVGTECALRSNNNKHSGGLPHSEIRGSKPIIGSPRLIADYHVLHRLLLPRHPPNALLALDPIQKNKKFIRVSPRSGDVQKLYPLKLTLSGPLLGSTEWILRHKPHTL